MKIRFKLFYSKFVSIDVILYYSHLFRNFNTEITEMNFCPARLWVLKNIPESLIIPLRSSYSQYQQTAEASSMLHTTCYSC
jgi:hypothetical protein